MRGNKLTPGSNMRWESMRMILPEHREAWLKHREDQKKVNKPIIDEQQWEEFSFTLRESMEYNQLIEFTHWADGFFYIIVGNCHFINHEQRQFHIVDTDDEIHYLKFDAVMDIKAV